MGINVPPGRWVIYTRADGEQIKTFQAAVGVERMSAAEALDDAVLRANALLDRVDRDKAAAATPPKRRKPKLRDNPEWVQKTRQDICGKYRELSAHDDVSAEQLAKALGKAPRTLDNWLAWCGMSFPPQCMGTAE